MATLLPTPEQQWIDANGNPLESGEIYTYVPGTTTAKATWQDSGQTTLNTNPIVLDSAGRAIIYGSGTYRFVVFDSAGNQIYDQLTADTAVGGIAFGGVSTGTENAQVIAASSFSQQDGQVVDFIAGLTNTGALTVAPGGGSGIPVLQDTPSGPSPLTGGEVVENNAVSLLYEASRGAFHLLTSSANIVGLGQAYTAPTNTTSAALRLAESFNAGTNTLTITVPTSLAADRTITWQDASGIPALLDVAAQTITGGARVTPDALGTINSGTVTLDPGNRALQSYTNGGAHTLAPGSNNGYILLDITNNASAGAITTSGWTKVVGAFTTTNGQKFRCFCSISTAGSLLTIQAMQ